MLVTVICFQRLPTMSAAVSLNPTTESKTFGGVRLMNRKTPPTAPCANLPTFCAFVRLRSTKAMPSIDTRQITPVITTTRSMTSQEMEPHSSPASVRRSTTHSRISDTPGAPKVMR